MSNALISSGQPNRVGALGRLASAAEQAELLALLAEYEAEPRGYPFEIDIYDADTLPAPIIDALARLHDRGQLQKIVAYRPLLTHCLLRLGLPVRQIAGPSPPTPLPPCRALVLGGSAQSLDKLLYIIGRLPCGETTIFVVQHVLENQTSLLDRLLQVHTDYRVTMPQHLLAVETATIYVAPPGRHLQVAHGLVYLTRDRKVNHARPSIDVLFASVAGEYRESALAVLLCGFGQDGVAGCAALKEAGACVIVENGDECAAARVLPDAAKSAGRFDHVMKYASIASVAAAAIAGTRATPTGELLELFIEALWQEYAYDLRAYQRDSLERRIAALMKQFALPGFVDFQRAILSHRPLFERMVAEIAVGVTGFFRHPEQFRLLREDIVPYLASFSVLKIWSAGCATGEEAFSLAILLEELGLLPRTRLFATDLNSYFLDLAASGLFPRARLTDNHHDYLASGGRRSFDDYFDDNGYYLRVQERLRQAILFHRHSLVGDGVFNEFQLIVCRNVMIYFDSDTQKKVLGLFARSLHRDGFLVLGPRDGLLHAARDNGFVAHANAPHVYRLRGIDPHER